jgi:hypothetical protein
VQEHGFLDFIVDSARNEREIGIVPEDDEELIAIRVFIVVHGFVLQVIWLTNDV